MENELASTPGIVQRFVINRARLRKILSKITPEELLMSKEIRKDLADYDLIFESFQVERMTNAQMETLFTLYGNKIDIQKNYEQFLKVRHIISDRSCFEFLIEKGVYQRDDRFI